MVFEVARVFVTIWFTFSKRFAKWVWFFGFISKTTCDGRESMGRFFVADGVFFDLVPERG